MPWRETCPMDQRRKFVAEWLNRDLNMAELCRSYGISRRTGYKWLGRFEEGGLAALSDRPKDSIVHPNATAAEISAQVVAFRQKHPFWGPRKIKRRLEELHPKSAWPASSTIGSILKVHGLVVPRRTRRRTPLYTGPFADGLVPNDVWAADFKGWFRTADGRRIDPLTVSDCASRYLIRCRAVPKTDGENVRGQLTAAFREFGMPQAIRTDNGAPFASLAIGGLSSLAVWLIKLGITPERIRPAHPEENGSHERMHRTLKQQTAKPPKANLRAQQEAFDCFRREFNDERPHESLGMKRPVQLYQPSPRAFPRTLPEMQYPAGSLVRWVSINGTFTFRWKQIYTCQALINEPIRLEETEDGWNTWYGPLLLGELNPERGVIRRLPTKVLPMRPV